MRTVSCYLGAGESPAAVAGGDSVDTAIGFTPLEGVVTATRDGSLDLGVLLWLQRQGGVLVLNLSGERDEHAHDRRAAAAECLRVLDVAWKPCRTPPVRWSRTSVREMLLSGLS